MAAQHGEQDLDRRLDRGPAIPQRPQTIPLGSAARWIDEDERERWSSRGFSFTRTAARRRRGDDDAGWAQSPERRRSARS